MNLSRLAAVKRKERRSVMGKYKSGDVFVFEIEKDERNGLYKVSGSNAYVPEVVLGVMERYCKENSEVGSILSVKEKAYKAGMDDAWEIAKKLVCPNIKGGMSPQVREKLFKDYSLWRIMNGYTAKDAGEIVKAYEELLKLKEGDIVEILNNIGVILDIENDIARVYVLTDADAKIQEVELYKLKSVGCSIDARGVLGRAYIIEKGTELKDVKGSV